MVKVGIVMLAAVASLASICASGGSNTRDMDVERLKSTSEQERQEGLKAIRQGRDYLITQLSRLAAVKTNPTPAKSTEDIEYVEHAAKDSSIRLLGEFRAGSASHVLLENLEYQNPNVPLFTSYGELGRLYPAAEALSKIGMPAIGPTVEKVAMYSQDGLGRQLCCWVINKVLGPRLGKLRIEIAIEETRDAKAKKNLESALGYFKTPEEKTAEELARRKEHKKTDRAQ